MTTHPLTSPVSPLEIIDSMLAAGVTHVVTVPDTHQRTLLAALSQQSKVPLITLCTEDEAFGVNLGLFMGGQKPVLLMQNTGFYASMNSLRGICLDTRVPACLLIGEFGRDGSLPSKANLRRTVNLLEPTLETWKVPYYRLDSAADLPNIALALDRAWDDRGPAAIIIGATTAELS
jgi:sulfopyruvate decarboxylase TPP-binding subunit